MHIRHPGVTTNQAATVSRREGASRQRFQSTRETDVLNPVTREQPCESHLQTEYTERDDGSVAETRILTDRFVPVIRAWDLTLGSPTWGEVLAIR